MPASNDGNYLRLYYYNAHVRTYVDIHIFIRIASLPRAVKAVKSDSLQTAAPNGRNVTERPATTNYYVYYSGDSALCKHHNILQNFIWTFYCYLFEDITTFYCVLQWFCLYERCLVVVIIIIIIISIRTCVYLRGTSSGAS